VEASQKKKKKGRRYDGKKKKYLQDVLFWNVTKEE
jgi:hypothetical protein